MSGGLLNHPSHPPSLPPSLLSILPFFASSYPPSSFLILKKESDLLNPGEWNTRNILKIANIFLSIIPQKQDDISQKLENRFLEDICIIFLIFYLQMWKEKPRDSKRLKAKQCQRDWNSPRWPSAVPSKHWPCAMSAVCKSSPAALPLLLLPGLFCPPLAFLCLSPRESLPTCHTALVSIATLQRALPPFTDSCTCHLLSDFSWKLQCSYCSLNCHALLPG